MEEKVISPSEREAWYLRENNRLCDGTYKRLPDSWRRSYWYINRKGALMYHFAHVSTTDGTMIAFTENDSKGVADRQTTVKPGRYLKKYYGDVLSDDEIRDLSTELCAKFDPPTMMVTQDADEIERIYVNGPRSCMSGRANEYGARIHPARVYAGPDLAIAYLEPRKGVITARCVVWPDKKRRSRIYGDATRLQEALIADGYKAKDQDMNGARLRRIPCDDGFVVPYVDFGGYAVEDYPYLRIDNDAYDGVILSNTCGTSEGNYYSCEECGTRLHPDDAFTICNCDGYYCDGCHQSVSFECAISGDCFHVDERIELHDGREVSERAFDRYCFTCPINDTSHAQEDGVIAPDGSGELWSQEAYDEYMEKKENEDAERAA